MAADESTRRTLYDTLPSLVQPELEIRQHAVDPAPEGGSCIDIPCPPWSDAPEEEHRRYANQVAAANMAFQAKMFAEQHREARGLPEDAMVTTILPDTPRMRELLPFLEASAGSAIRFVVSK